MQIFYSLGSRPEGSIFSRLKQFISTNKFQANIGVKDPHGFFLLTICVFPVRRKKKPPWLKIEHKVTSIHSWSHISGNDNEIKKISAKSN